MSDEHLERDSHPIDHEVWWYEERQGIAIIVQIREGGPKSPLIAGKVINIPWGQLRAALARKERKLLTTKPIVVRNAIIQHCTCIQQSNLRVECKNVVIHSIFDKRRKINR